MQARANNNLIIITPGVTGKKSRRLCNLRSLVHINNHGLEAALVQAERRRGGGAVRGDDVVNARALVCMGIIDGKEGANVEQGGGGQSSCQQQSQQLQHTPKTKKCQSMRRRGQQKKNVLHCNKKKRNTHTHACHGIRTCVKGLGGSQRARVIDNGADGIAPVDDPVGHTHGATHTRSVQS